MEKYGVDQGQDQELSKVAADQCPWCAAKVELVGQVRLCPTHGSKPFEREDP